MDSTVRAILAVLMRWIHIGSVITLLGGFLYSRFVLAPALAALPRVETRLLGEETAARFRPFIVAVVCTLLGSGLYNYVTKSPVPPGYHMWMGIKLLLALHVFAAALLWARSGVDQAKRNRQATGIIISGVVIVMISGWLRYISLAALVRHP